ncbi:hypothetical protein Neosp_006846 [[Neocosmospora] mangrovei]
MAGSRCTALRVNDIFPVLQALLDSAPGTLLHKKTAHLAPAARISSISSDEVDAAGSYVATIYRLPKSFPERFPENSAASDSVSTTPPSRQPFKAQYLTPDRISSERWRQCLTSSRVFHNCFEDNLLPTTSPSQRSFHHIGQKHTPVWAVTHRDDLFDAHEQCQLAWQEAKVIAEVSPQEYEAVSGLKIPEIHQSITGQHRLICAFEIGRSLRKAMVSCYPRVRMHWPNMALPECITEGKFYAAVGRFLMANPSTTHLFTKATMQRIASTWEPGTELSMARIVGNCPALPNGVEIYNFVTVSRSTTLWSQARRTCFEWHVWLGG